MIALSGYKVTEQIYGDNNTVLYRGIRELDRESVLIKTFTNEYPTLEELASLKHEYKIAKDLESEGIIKHYSLENHQNGLALILEDFGCGALKEFTSSKTLQITEFLEIAIQLAKALEELHNHKIIHKDIKPSNIIISNTGKVKITGFGIASQLSRQAASNANLLEGTLAYISPEQTGRMNRTIDYRTDFYSLGMTFYELLTGQLPFQATDPLEFVHCHIALTPVPPHELNPEISTSVSNIVMKLLAKTAEDRYQSARGLRADLEQGLNQLVATGQVSNFTPGQQDLSGQFHIPQKLYGREAEVATLMDAFDRVSSGTTEMMLVSGYSGIGKSSLVNEIHKPIVRQRGYFIAGKFDQFKRNIPYASLIQAFQDLIRQLLTENSEKIAFWKRKLLDAFSPNAQVMIDVIPEVELIIGKQPPVPQLGATESQNRFNRVFKQFIHVFSKREHPLVLFLDDLQWADSASLKLIQLLMSDPHSQYLLMIGAYRDNEVSAAHPLMLTLDEMHSAGVRMNAIALRPLEVAHINQLIADTLGGAFGRTEPLAELVLSKTHGNPFFLNQLLTSLNQDNLLSFDFQSGCWQWDIEQIQGMAIADDVVELMISRIQKLTEPTQQVLKLAACIGNRFDLDVLALVSEQSTVTTATDLWPALQAGLILPLSNAYKIPLVVSGPWPAIDSDLQLTITYRFLHDRVQQAAYTLIPEERKKAVHLSVGRLLLKSIEPEELEEKVFDIVNHLNVSAKLLTSQTEKYELAEFNLMAGKKAKVSTAYAASLKYITSGIKLLPNDAWDSHYELTFSLYKERSECEYLCGNFERAEELFCILKNKARSNLEKADVYNIQMVVYANLNKYTDGINLALEGLRMFGCNLPETEEECQTATEVELQEVRSNLINRNVVDLIDLPEMVDPNKKACMSFLTNLQVHAFDSSPALLSWIILKRVNISLKYGNTEASAFSYVMFGSILGPNLEDYELGYEFGKIALELNEKFNCLALAAKVYNWFSQAIHPWHEHIKSSLPFLKKAYQFGLDSGDLLFAGFAFGQAICHRIMKGDELGSIYDESKACLSFYQQIKDERMTIILIVWQRLCLNLQGLTKDKYTLNSDDDFDENQHLEKVNRNGSCMGIVWYHLIKLQTSFLYENYEDAIKMALVLENSAAIPGQLSIVEHYFYYSLTIAALYSGLTTEDREVHWKTLEKNQVRMKRWANNCPDNFLHKYLLVAAEMARISGNDIEAMKLYDQAIKSAEENEYIQNAAVGNELAAKFYLTNGFYTIARTYITEARCGYAKWGATAKVKDLDEKYPQLLSRNAREIQNTSTKASVYTTFGNSGLLDLETVVKSSLALSGEIVLERLLEKLMQIAIENAGAQKGLFMAKKEDKLVIEAEGAVNKGVILQPTPVEDCCNLPISIINYVEITKEHLVLDDASCEKIFSTDSYIVANQPKSILCLPIIYQGKLTGILYLENNLATAAFTPERLEVLKLLTSQISVSIENALLYTNLHTYSQELEVKNKALQQSEARSREQALQLKHALHDLQQAQTQLVQTEKMSGLGQLVAGIAHELNNPINFISGNVFHAKAYVQDLLSLLRLYQQQYPHPTPEIQAEREAIELDFLVEDLTKIVDSMKMGTDRIQQLVLSLRNFSRLDEAQKKPVDIHDGLESTLLILQHRLRASADPAIQTIKEYGDLPLVECYAGQLNQVFMNLLANAIDALEEGIGASAPNPGVALLPRILGQDRAKGKGEGPDTPSIWIRTEVSADPSYVVIRIADNGPGMTEKVRQRLFDPFFTTKPVGKGTGLGLSISYQIVVEKHGGQLTCISAPGQGAEFAIAIPLQQHN